MVPLTTNLLQNSMNPSRPQATPFTSWIGTGKVEKYFIKNNPWKLSSDNESQKIYRYCIVCGISRFTDQEWETLDSMLWRSAIICLEDECFKSLWVIAGFIPRKHYLIETDADQLRVEIARTTECFEEIEEEEAEEAEELDNETPHSNSTDSSDNSVSSVSSVSSTDDIASPMSVSSEC